MKLWLLILSFSFVFLDTEPAMAFKYLQDKFHLSATFDSYSDIKRTEGSNVELSEAVGIEVGGRFQRLFRVFLSGAYGLDGGRTEFGLGFRVDLPGLFLFNAKMQHFIKKGMSKPVNTSFYAKAHSSKVTSESGATKLDTFTSDIGVSLSMFPTKRSKSSYIRLDLGIYSLNGNAFLKYGVGLGMAF